MPTNFIICPKEFLDSQNSKTLLSSHCRRWEPLQHMKIWHNWWKELNKFSSFQQSQWILTNCGGFRSQTWARGHLIIMNEILHKVHFGCERQRGGDFNSIHSFHVNRVRVTIMHWLTQAFVSINGLDHNASTSKQRRIGQGFIRYTINNIEEAKCWKATNFCSSQMPNRKVRRRQLNDGRDHGIMCEHRKGFSSTNMSAVHQSHRVHTNSKVRVPMIGASWVTWDIILRQFLWHRTHWQFWNGCFRLLQNLLKI